MIQLYCFVFSNDTSYTSLRSCDWAFRENHFLLSEGNPSPESTAKIIGPRCNLGEKEGLQVPCSLRLVVQKKFVEVLIMEFSKMVDFEELYVRINKTLIYCENIPFSTIFYRPYEKKFVISRYFA